jgi:hypothetical protein
MTPPRKGMNTTQTTQAINVLGALAQDTHLKILVKTRYPMPRWVHQAVKRFQMPSIPPGLTGVPAVADNRFHAESAVATAS